MFKKILVPLDRSARAEQALPRAVALAYDSAAALDLVLVHERRLGVQPDSEWDVRLREDEDRYLEALVADIASRTGVRATHAVPVGDPGETICARARDVQADLIVMSSHGRTGFDRALLGSIADHVIQHADIPVLMVRPKNAEGRRRLSAVASTPLSTMIVLLDGSEHAEAILDAAADLALGAGSNVVLLRVEQPVPLVVRGIAAPWSAETTPIDDAETKRLVDEARIEMATTALDLAGRGLADIHIDVVTGPSVPQAILDAARRHRADVIAMSTHGRGASRLLVGSVADKVLRGSDMSVLMYRPAEVRAHLGIGVEQQLPAMSGT